MDHPATAPALGGRRPPLCVDLDGTLIRSDTLVEGIGNLLGDWRAWIRLPLSLARGRAALKQHVADAASFDAALLPYDQSMLAMIRAARAEGREVALVTAADRRIADAVADHLGLFDTVLASDGALNLKGRAKAEALVGRYGEKGFVYAGNDASDLAIWRRAAAAVVVNAPAGLVARARRAGVVEAVLDHPGGTAKALLRAARPYQWVKNLLVFVPIVTAHALSDLSAWRRAILAAMAFSLVASAIYVINDISDLDADRRHPRKRKRPFASGAAPIHAAILMPPVLLLAGCSLAVGAGVLPLLLLYGAVSIGYSIWLKQYPLVDLFVLAGLYTIRLYAGGEASGYHVSAWLLAFSSFFFLGLAAVKRAAEILPLARAGGGKATISRRGYTALDGDFIMMLGVAASFVGTLVLALYVQSDWMQGRQGSPGPIWLVVPLLLFWQCRIWLATARGDMDDDPIIYAARDWVSRLVAACVFIVFVVADGSALRLLRRLLFE
ncbi:MAG: UbiA family prenyltransferase [Alphaproteobacteria bacterium]|nr:UbiA family prenyltransferase [Alphaproteobacteria bacterium]